MQNRREAALHEMSAELSLAGAQSNSGTLRRAASLAVMLCKQSSDPGTCGACWFTLRQNEDLSICN